MRATACFLALLLSGCGFEVESTGTIAPSADGERCRLTGDTLTCAHATAEFEGGAFGATTRQVHFMTPATDAPDEGFPVAILFQGSFHSAEGMWSSTRGDDFGGFHETELVEALLDAGFAVVTPETRFDGSTFWDTNVVPFSSDWELSEDNELMLALLDAIDAGELGPLDDDRLYAAGISSGGYMTSRMAVSYPGRFRRLAIQSASYATCSGALCVVPELRSDHPPTLFLHGQSDLIVPIGTMRDYAGALASMGVQAPRFEDPSAGHEWLAEAPEQIVDWFLEDAR
ncbi:MAG: hypothetical protein U0271_19090 [Polyangiaceae bacterium]